MQDVYLSPKQVAEIVGVSVKTVWSWIDAGKLPAFKIGGGRNLRVRRSDVDAFMVPCAGTHACSADDCHQTEQAEV